MKEEVKALWKLCFNDSQEFIDMYFRMRYNNDVNVAIKSGEEVVSALQMLPYPMTYCGLTVHTSYVSGACTHPDFRGNGFMRELLSQAFTRMLHHRMHFSTLIPAEPWLFDYYERMGYATVFHYAVKEITVPDFIPSKGVSVDLVTKYDEEVYQYLNSQLAKRTCCIQHTQADFQVIMEDLAISSGFLFVARQEDRINGLAFVYKRGRQLIINEFLAEDKDVEHCLLHYTKQYTGCNQITQLLPPEKKQAQHRLGMARIINAKEVLSLYATAFPEQKMQLELTDKHLSANNGYYYLYGGKCMFSDQRLPGAHLQMNIKDLTAKVFQRLNPYMSLMLN